MLQRVVLWSQLAMAWIATLVFLYMLWSMRRSNRRFREHEARYQQQMDENKARLEDVLRRPCPYCGRSIVEPRTVNA